VYRCLNYFSLWNATTLLSVFLTAPTWMNQQNSYKIFQPNTISSLSSIQKSSMRRGNRQISFIKFIRRNTNPQMGSPVGSESMLHKRSISSTIPYFLGGTTEPIKTFTGQALHMEGMFPIVMSSMLVFLLTISSINNTAIHTGTIKNWIFC